MAGSGRSAGNGKKALEALKADFALSTADMRHIVRNFHREMKSGLCGRKSSLKMIPTYVDRPTGAEKGRFIALDLGGTNFRVLSIELWGRGRASEPEVMKFALPKACTFGPGSRLFDFLSSSIDTFLTRQRLTTKGPLELGFTFSFPVRQTGVASGTLVTWTKGFEATGVVGQDVVVLLQKALGRRGIRNIHVAALANDTVGTMVTRSYADHDCDMGVILGTGTNACYAEKTAYIKKWKPTSPPTKRMIINIEWGNFNKLRSTRYDRRLDAASDNRGRQILEKMVSGMYLGSLCGYALAALAEKGVILRAAGRPAAKKLRALKSEDVSEIEMDHSAGLGAVERVLGKAGITRSVPADRAMVKDVCLIVSGRAARISAAAIAAVVTKMDPRLARKHTVAIDGSVYEKHPLFDRKVKAALKELLGRRSRRLRLVLSKDGSGKGAAIIAAVAAMQGMTRT